MSNPGEEEPKDMISKMLLQNLNIFFGRHKYRNQIEEEAVNAIFKDSKKDVYICMQSVNSRSMCSYLPIISKNDSLAIIISPFPGQAENEVLFLKTRGIQAHLWDNNIDVSIKNKTSILEDLLSKSPTVQLLFIPSAEVAESDSFQNIISKIGKNILSHFVIHEAQYLSPKSHDYRPTYNRLKEFRKICPNAQFIATTTAANDEVKNDIFKALSFEHPFEFSTPILRPAVYYDVVCLDSLKCPFLHLLAFIRDTFKFKDKTPNEMSIYQGKNDCGIIYCSTKDVACGLSIFLNFHGIPTKVLAGEMEMDDRKYVYNLWNAGVLRVLITTLTFSNLKRESVRFVVHWKIPRSIATYYEETSVAGDDGRPAFCRIYFSADVYEVYNSMYNYTKFGELEKIDSTLLKNNSNVNLGITAMQNFKLVLKYLSSLSCRYEFFHKYYGQKSAPCCSCDWCYAKEVTERRMQVYRTIIAQKSPFSIEYTRTLLPLIGKIEEYFVYKGSQTAIRKFFHVSDLNDVAAKALTCPSDKEFIKEIIKYNSSTYSSKNFEKKSTRAIAKTTTKKTKSAKKSNESKENVTEQKMTVNNKDLIKKPNYSKQSIKSEEPENSIPQRPNKGVIRNILSNIFKIDPEKPCESEDSITKSVTEESVMKDDKDSKLLTELEQLEALNLNDSEKEIMRNFLFNTVEKARKDAGEDKDTVREMIFRYNLEILTTTQSIRRRLEDKLQKPIRSRIKNINDIPLTVRRYFWNKLCRVIYDNFTFFGYAISSYFTGYMLRKTVSKIESRVFEKAKNISRYKYYMKQEISNFEMDSIEFTLSEKINDVDFDRFLQMPKPLCSYVAQLLNRKLNNCLIHCELREYMFKKFAKTLRGEETKANDIRNLVKLVLNYSDIPYKKRINLLNELLNIQFEIQVKYAMAISIPCPIEHARTTQPPIDPIIVEAIKLHVSQYCWSKYMPNQKTFVEICYVIYLAIMSNRFKRSDALKLNIANIIDQKVYYIPSKSYNQSNDQSGDQSNDQSNDNNA